MGERHDAVISAYLDWVFVGKPKYGHYLESMKKVVHRLAFKLAVR